MHVTEDGGRAWQTISPDLTAFTPETQVVSGDPITIDVTGEEHFSVIYEIQESTHERGVLWVGANDGPIHISRDNGANWKEVTPPGIRPYGRVQNIEVSPHQPSKAYAAILRDQLGDFTPHAYKTTDYGETWTRITTGTNGIPNDHPVRVVREDPDRAGLLYAGTEFGMFISFDDGDSWQSFQLNLPVTPITDLKVFDKEPGDVDHGSKFLDPVRLDAATRNRRQRRRSTRLSVRGQGSLSSSGTATAGKNELQTRRAAVSDNRCEHRLLPREPAERERKGS